MTFGKHIEELVLFIESNIEETEQGVDILEKYTTLRRNYLINSTRKYDDLGDWLYFKLMINNAGTLIKAALGNTEEYDKLLDEMFYDYNDNHR